LIESMFHLPLPVMEKILRPVIVYLFLVGFLRLFGKRELAQLNPFDLVVLLSLSNTVQNAMIGDDNSVTGGVIGATIAGPLGASAATSSSAATTAASPAAASGTFVSNESAAHEAGESAAREAQENAGQRPTVP